MGMGGFEGGKCQEGGSFGDDCQGTRVLRVTCEDCARAGGSRVVIWRGWVTWVQKAKLLV